MEVITWTKGIDQKTGLPIDYDPKRDIQVYSGPAKSDHDGPHQKAAPVA
jgi:alcohol dehydrogenase (cytochrome c)